MRRDEQSWSEVVTTVVEMDAVSSEWIEWYVSTGEPMDKAGGYAVQGLGAVLVTAVRGSMTNVIGLPVTQTCSLLSAAGIDLRLSSRIS